jgi:formate-dependent nitrite reductase membrane component NrfD
MAFYLLTKGIATGALLVGALLWWLGYHGALTTLVAPTIAVVFITATALILVIDLERPERFFYILTRPNWNSWLARGAFILTGFGTIAALWLGAGLLQRPGVISWLLPLAVIAGVLASSYTAFLFAQGLARDLWQGPYAAVDLLAQSVIEGAAVLLVATPFVTTNDIVYRFLAGALALGIVAHLLLLGFEHLTPSPTLHHRLAVRSILRGAYSRQYWVVAVLLGGVAPLVLLRFAPMSGGAWIPMNVIAAMAALAGAFAWEYIWIEAGQAVPNS